MWANIRKTLLTVFVIWTGILLFIVYKNIEFSFVLQFIIGYSVFGLLLFIETVLSAFFNVRKLKWIIIKKMLFRFIINTFTIWGLTVLLIYLTKSELRIMDKLFSSLAISFGSTFGSLAFEKRNNDY